LKLGTLGMFAGLVVAGTLGLGALGEGGEATGVLATTDGAFPPGLGGRTTVGVVGGELPSPLPLGML